MNAIRIPESIKEISEGAFSNCENLTNLEIPSSVSIIGTKAFEMCINLNSITVNWNLPISIKRSVFDGLNLASITLKTPNETAEKYEISPVWLEFKKFNLNTTAFSALNRIVFYPNPAKSQINFSSELKELQLFDLSGKLIRLYQNKSSTFDVSNLNEGIYLIKALTIDNQLFDKKLIKL
jgi:hypothetical protein